MLASWIEPYVDRAVRALERIADAFVATTHTLRECQCEGCKAARLAASAVPRGAKTQLQPAAESGPDSGDRSGARRP